MPRVAAEGVTLEPLAPAHAAGIQALAADPRIGATSRVPHPYPPDGAAQFIALKSAARADGTAHVAAILLDGAVVGCCGLEDLRQPEGAELGYWVGVPYWGRGIAGAAVRLMLAHAFGPLGLAVVRARVLEANDASVRVLERSGFSRVALAPNTDGALHPLGVPVARYRLRREAWAPAG